MAPNPFVDVNRFPSLYASADRLGRRTAALRAAKISGRDAVETIVEIAERIAPTRPVVCEIGCGRGSTTLALAARLRPRQLIAVDRSHALLAVVGRRAADAGDSVTLVEADFHHLPFRPAAHDVAVAAFCLYHSPTPDRAVAEIARCLMPGGHAVLVTKSADSYHQIDELVQDCGLDLAATSRPSLYGSFHSLVAAEVAATALHVVAVVHEDHVFRFTGRDHLAAYLATSPKYADHGAGYAEQLRQRLPDAPLTVTSTVTYVTATRR